MKRIFLITGFILMLGTMFFWYSKGAHTGWTQNRVPVTQTDEVTGIAYTTYEDRFVPGLDVLAGGSLVAAVCFAISIFVRSTPKSNITS